MGPPHSHPILKKNQGPERRRKAAPDSASQTEAPEKGGKQMNKGTHQSREHPSRDLEGPRLADLYPHNVPTALVQVDLAAQTHQGLVRKSNEDHYLAVRVTRC